MSKMMMRLFFLILLICPLASIAQDTTIVKGVPALLNNSTLIILKHETIEVGTDEEDPKTKEYVIHRQENHNRVSKEFNAELTKHVKENYPFNYVLAYPSELDSLMTEETFVFNSNVYSYKYLRGQPNEGELILFPYYITNKRSDTLYTLFDLDEMKVYDAKMILKKLKKEVKRQFPDSY